MHERELAKAIQELTIVLHLLRADRNLATKQDVRESENRIIAAFQISGAQAVKLVADLRAPTDTLKAAVDEQSTQS